MKYFPQTPGVLQVGTQRRKKIPNEEETKLRGLIIRGTFSVALVDLSSEIEIIFPEMRGKKGKEKKHLGRKRERRGDEI